MGEEGGEFHRKDHNASEPQPNRTIKQTAETRRAQRTEIRIFSLRPSRLCG